MKAAAGRLVPILLAFALIAVFAPALTVLEPALAQPLAPAAAERTEDRVLVFFRLPPEHFRPNSDYGGYQDAVGRRAVRRMADRQAARHGLTLVDDWPLPILGLDCYVMAVPAGESPQEVAARLSGEPNVAWAEPMSRYVAQDSVGGEVTHDDPLFAFQPAALEWRLAALHEIATGRGVTVAVIDSAVETQHPDLAGQVAIHQNFVEGRPDTAEAHGTAVAGVIAARADNALGVVGVAPEARLMALRACWRDGAADGADGTVCDTLSLAKALHFAIENDAEVVNLSLAGPPAPVLGRLLDAAIDRDIVVVAAFDPAQPGGGFPASHPGVVAVADESTAGAPFVAPGRDVPTTQPDGRWSFVSGSSYSAAHVSGLFALFGERGTPQASSLVATSSGAIDACATLLHAAPCPDCACAQISLGWTSAQQ